MRVEVDQSGKIGDTKVPTVLAYSNGRQYAVLIPVTVKRECLHRLRRQGKAGKTIYIRLFAIGLYFLLKDHIHLISSILIDLEYPGKDGDIKLYLTNLFRRSGIKFNPSIIRFGQIGKKSRAHLKAFTVFSKTQQPDKRMSVKQLLAEY